MFVLFREKLVTMCEPCCEHTETLSALRTTTCLCIVVAAPSYVGQVSVHLGARTNCFRIGEEGTRRLSSCSRLRDDPLTIKSSTPAPSNYPQGAGVAYSETGHARPAVGCAGGPLSCPQPKKIYYKNTKKTIRCDM